MRKHSPSELSEFLRALDRELTKPTRVVLIGGGVISLKYKGSHATADLDLWSTSNEDVWAAAARANQKLVTPVPLQKAPIAQPPYSFEDRLERLAIDGLKKLEILVPEAHDMVLLKVGRGEAHDLDAIEDIHRAAPLQLETLVTRYFETKTQVVGSLETHRLNFLAAVARLFGERVAEDVERRTRS